MPDAISPGDPAPGRPPVFTITLLPFAARGPTALAPDDSLGIRHVSLACVVQHWNNAFNEVTIRKADDLFACAARDGACFEPAPKGATLTEAVLEVQFADFPDPHQVTLKPPHTLILQHPADSPRVIHYLRKREFLIFNS